jgi:predicted homoserine dehydrogenase-like protein
MNLQALLAARTAANKPIRVGLIGAGKFGSMFLAQVPTIAGLEVAVIADLDPDRARAAMSAGIPPASRARISPRAGARPASTSASKW